MRGQLVEAEHLARYVWACRDAAGRRVLDVGCGTAYGAGMLAAAGATSVAGVDRAGAVLEAARPTMPATVTLVEGDATALPFADASFDLITVFELIEHVEQPESVLAEVSRVLAPGGIALISTPNRDVYVPGNPHHVHEYVPGELSSALARYFAHIELRRQSNLIVSAVMPDDVAERDDLDPVHGLRLVKRIAVPPGSETYTVARVSQAPLPPDPDTTTVATGLTEVRRWLELYDDQRQMLERQNRRLQELAQREHDLREARAALAASERVNAVVPDLRAEVDALRHEVEELRAAASASGGLAEEAAALRGRTAELEERVERAARVLAVMQASPSWRITAPLRAAKDAVRRLSPLRLARRAAARLRRRA